MPADLPRPTVPMSLLDRALQLAVQAHAGQVDKAGAPYILHPLRVMLRLHSEDERVVAVLHDVLEDSPVTLAELQALGLTALQCEALDRLTRRESQSYEQFIERVSEHALARRVKLADLADNLDRSRLAALGELGDRELERLARYERAQARLLACEPFA